MPRHAANAAILAIILAAALLPGAAVSRVRACSYAPFDLALMAETGETIVLARATAVNEDRAEFQPEAFLKGPVTAGTLALSAPDRTSTCEPAVFTEGERYVLFLAGSQWPYAGSVITLAPEGALWLGAVVAPGEEEIVDGIREVTEQYAVPPATAAESQGIDWWKTIVPVSAAVLGIFIAGLFLMRIWHRIDPS